MHPQGLAQARLPVFFTVFRQIVPGVADTFAHPAVLRRIAVMRKLLLTLLMSLCLLASLPADGAADRAAAMLSELASALKMKNLSSLRDLIDAQSMVYVGTILHAPGYPKKDPLETLPNTTSLDAFRRVEEQLFDRLGNGMEQDECRYAWRSGCPWLPEAISKAVLIAESEDTAIYAVDNRRGIRTWLLLKQESGTWRAWAIAESDKEARLIASRAFQETLSRVRRELPALIEAKAKARTARQHVGDAEYTQRAAAIEQRTRAEKTAKDAVACRILRIAAEERLSPPMIAAPPFSVLILTLEVYNANSFAILPRTWALTFSHQDGTLAKTVTLGHHESGDALTLSAGERRTLTLTTRSIDEKYIDGWNKGAYSAKAELLHFDRQ